MKSVAFFFTFSKLEELYISLNVLSSFGYIIHIKILQGHYFIKPHFQFWQHFFGNKIFNWRQVPFFN